MAAPPQTPSAGEIQRLSSSIRAASQAKAEISAPTFTSEIIAKAREMQRTNMKEYDQNIVTLLKTLESFQPSGGIQNEVQCALITLSILLRLDLAPPCLSQCNSCVRVCLNQSSDFATMKFAAQVFGFSVTLSGPNDFIRKATDDAMVWISLAEARSEVRRLGGLNMLSEVIRKVPVLFLKNLSDFFDKIWTCLADPIPEVRDSALVVFKEAIRLLNTREKHSRFTIYSNLFLRLKAALQNKSVDQNIGGLIAFEPVVLSSTEHGDAPKYEEVVQMLQQLLQNANNPNAPQGVRLLLFHVMAVLCRFNPQSFVQVNLKNAVNYGLEYVRRDVERAAAFKMLGEIVSLVKQEGFAPFLDQTCLAIKQVFLQQKKTGKVWEALECLAVICKTCPTSTVEAYVSSSIEHVFGYGLSTQLIDCMKEIVSSAFPKARLRLEENMLDLISVTLCGLPFRQPSGASSRTADITASVAAEVTEDQIVIALNALLKFGFSNSELMGDFLRDSVLPFVDSENQSIRMAAIRTVIMLLIPENSAQGLTFSRRICVDLVVTKLLILGGSDPNPRVRLLVYSSFSPSYFSFLCEPQFLLQVCNALGDEDSGCHIAVMKLLCGMLSRNPSHILPVLRKEIVKVLQTIASTDQHHLLQESLKVVAAIAAEAPVFVTSFFGNIMEVTTPLLLPAHPRTPYLLELLNCLTRVSQAAMFTNCRKPNSDKLIEKCLELLHNLPNDKPSLDSRLMCVQLLSATLRPTMNGVSPYQQFPVLYKVLSSIVRNKEECSDIRLAALQCTGRIGALDPHQFAALEIHEGIANNRFEGIAAFGKLTHEKCAMVVLQAMAMLLDPRSARVAGGSESLVRCAVKTLLLISEHSSASHGELHVVFSPLCALLSTMVDSRLFYTVLFEMANLITLCGSKSFEHLDSFQSLARSLWSNQNTRFLVVRICGALSQVDASASPELAAKFNSYFAKLLPTMLDSLATSENDYFRKSVLEFFLRNEAHLRPFVHRIVSTLLEVLESSKTSVEYATYVVTVLRQLAMQSPLHELTAPIVRCVLTKLNNFMTTTSPVPSDTNPFVQRLLSLVCVMLAQQPFDFAPFASDVLRTLKALHINHQYLLFMCMQCSKGAKVTLRSASIHEMDAQVKELMEQVFEASCLKGLAEFGEIWGSSAKTTSADASATQDAEAVLPIAEQKIIDKCRIPTTNSKDEWLRWFEDLCKEVIKEAPYHVFRCVSLPLGVNSASLAERCPEFVQDILNTAFRCLYTQASMALKGSLAECLAKAAANHSAPDDVVSTILGIAEYLDMASTPLPIQSSQLAEVARVKGMLAKALYWQELAYQQNPKECSQDLMTVYSHLGHMDSAVGLLSIEPRSDRAPVGQQQVNLIKLGRFAEALELIIHDKGSIENSPNQSIFPDESFIRSSLVASPHVSRARSHARTRSLSMISDGDESFAQNVDPEVARKLETEVRKILCLSELGDMHSVLGEWRDIVKKVGQQKEKDDDEENILNYVAPFAADAAMRLKAWEDLADVLPYIPPRSIACSTTQAVLHMHTGAYDQAHLSIQEARTHLLDEITGLMHESYARAYDGIVVSQQLVELEESLAALRLTDPHLRSAHTATIASLWMDRISTVVPAITPWKRILSSRGVLISPTDDVATRILFVKLCQEHGASSRLERFTLEQLLGCRSPAYDQLIDPSANPKVVFEYVKHLSENNELQKYGGERQLIAQLIEIHGGKPENAALEARMHARRGYRAEVQEAIQCYEQATHCDPSWFRAWRFWAEANLKYLDSNHSDAHVIHAIQGFVKSIELSPSNSTAIQDVLKLLSVWSRHADNEVGLATLEKSVLEVPLAIWQLVIPQLIARLDSGSDASCRLVADLIAAVAKEYPQSLIYPLNVCTTSNVARRKEWANHILEKMEKDFPQLVAQGRVVSTELIRLASLIYEQWYEHFENAATAFFGKRNYLDMLDVMLPAHESLKKTPETLVEVEFHAKYHRQLEEARAWLRSFSFTGKVADLHCAWNIYHAIYKQIDEQLKSNNTLSMQYCSPKLWEAKGLELTIPDARPREGRETIRIASFGISLTVIASKQRPKRIAMLGTDGKTHRFLLKGHEDLRLDERVMQLFKLVNTLLLSNTHTSKVSGHQIQRYSVTPLWDTVGLIGWVDECDTIHQLIHKHREERGVFPELELKMMPQIITVDHPKAFDYLPVMSKVEVLEYLWDHTSGHDIRKAMWCSSLNCETWLERRQTYTTSLATMSVVGYILGLGDRHPNNIMIQRSTGKVVHIDFGDCFEVAMTRDRFPEKIPFRLTRMLCNAMEVCGVDGRFRTAAEQAMTVLRENRDSLIAMLAAFVHDPLISWRLVKRPGEEPTASGEPHAGIGEAAVNNMISGEEEEEMASPLMLLVPFSDDDDLSAVSDATRRKRNSNSATNRLHHDEEVAHQGIAIMNRLVSKLRGQDFANSIASRRAVKKAMDPKTQVSKLIAEATDISNLAQSWSGWYPFW